VPSAIHQEDTDARDCVFKLEDKHHADSAWEVAELTSDESDDTGSDFTDILWPDTPATEVDSSEDSLEESLSEGLISQARPERH
jgi:hypothetical protein